MFKRLLCLLLPLCLFFSLAQAATAITVETGECAVSYAFTLPQEQFAILEYKTSYESGKMVVYASDGNFSGEIALPLSGAGGNITLTLTSMAQKKLGEAKAALPTAKDYIAPSGDSHAAVKSFVLTETPLGFDYSFMAPDSDYLMLSYRNKQESGLMPIYPVNEDGLYSGSITLPITYARTLSTVKIINGKEIVLKEGQVRKGYEAPPAPKAQDGRLSGVTVCIDAGHQENGVPVMEPIGPGLEGKSAGTSGMAQGRITLRKESIVCLEVAMALRDELIRQGATVVMTRERQDQFLTNQERCAIAAEGNADIMLRLHCDTRENSNKQGISIFGPRNSTYAKAVADPETYAYMGNLLLNAMKERLGYEAGEKTGFVTINDQFVGNNWAQMVCFLVEMGFMSNPEEDFLLSTPVYQQWLAEAMAQGVYEIALYREWFKN